MTRKAFLEDVALAAEKNITGVCDVKRGDEDGELNFTYVPVAGSPVAINILVTDVSDYPASNQFVLYTLGDAEPAINHVLERFKPQSCGTRIQDLILQISLELQAALASGSQDQPYRIDDDPDDAVPGSDSEVEEDLFSFGSPSSQPSTSYSNIDGAASLAFNNRIIADLRTTRFAGFKVGILSGMKAHSSSNLISLSVRVAKLGLSDETLQAWDLQKLQYVVLLVRFPGFYKTFDTIIENSTRCKDIEFRIGVCSRYKPDITEALAAFSTASKNSASQSAQDNGDLRETHDAFGVAGFHSLFVSSSLNEFLNDQFIPLLKIRHARNVDWDGAKRILRHTMGKIRNENASTPTHDEPQEEPQSTKSELPEFLVADHFKESNDDTVSLPLVAVQFAMKYLVRCTEFCLICHDKTEETFEAMKPYVCSKPLCLYQYMSLGFGPSLEHEILTQPYVVDLLVSFCYNSAKALKLREYPTGMSLSVPQMRHDESLSGSPYRPMPVKESILGKAQSAMGRPQSESHKVKYDSVRSEVILEPDSCCTLRRGDWVALSINGSQCIHRRVKEVLIPTIRLSNVEVACASSLPDDNIGYPPNQASPISTPMATPPPSSTVTADMALYNVNFDDLTPTEKSHQIVMLLETIPSIKEMRSYLINAERHSTARLQNWCDRISPAALGLIRWIVASNRSCIVQIDNCPGQDDSDFSPRMIHLDQKVTNMAGYVQFRFAQGAPDKEQRFHKALIANKDKLIAEYPTLFAWHGSTLANWHSIIRSGLDFDVVANGRAFGDGCYHSQDLRVSLGYSFNHGSAPIWPGSSLQITQAVCLNEIVNLPKQFRSSSPHLVVQYVDWIQCRYLFVKTTSNTFNEIAMQTSHDLGTSMALLIQQDPNFKVMGSNREPIGIPTTASSASRAISLRENWLVGNAAGKRRKFTSPSQKGSVSPRANPVSDDEDLEDLAFLISNDDGNTTIGDTNDTSKIARSGSGFIAGSLDQSTLKMMKPPVYATSTATRTLTRELATIMKIQQSTPAAELGWYIDENMSSNVYQWIVELHSFELSLPLAQDMKDAGITSVVLEILFGKDYPISPPFVRVIRPRFLPFMQGGGGHVTAGGALCMELLTNSGWSAVSSIESVLLQVRMAIMNLEPKPARLQRRGSYGQQDYGLAEAVEAYIRACNAHGWEVPKDFREFGIASEN